MSLDLTQLAARARAGDRSAFSDLVRRFEGPLFQFLNLRSPSREDAEELTQETFLRAWKYLDRYDPSRPFATWLFTLGRRLSISAHRKRRLRTDRPELLEGVEDPAHPAGIASRREQDANLWRIARQVLSEEAHAALWLRYGEELELDAIAGILGKRPATVRVILFRARARMARALPHVHPGQDLGDEPRAREEARARQRPTGYPARGALDPSGPVESLEYGERA